jgi:hypothetical protein
MLPKRAGRDLVTTVTLRYQSQRVTAIFVAPKHFGTLRCEQLLDLHVRVDRTQWAGFCGQDGQPASDRHIHRVGRGHIQAPGLQCSYAARKRRLLPNGEPGRRDPPDQSTPAGR